MYCGLAAQRSEPTVGTLVRLHVGIVILTLTAACCGQGEAAAPPANCSAQMNAWCDVASNCNADAPGPKPATAAGGPRGRVALHDTNPKHDPPAWRCYPPSDLNPARTAYVSGEGICTRNAQLAAVLARCMGGVPGPAPAPAPPEPTPQPLGVVVFAPGRPLKNSTQALVTWVTGAINMATGNIPRCGSAQSLWHWPNATFVYSDIVSYQDKFCSCDSNRSG